MTLKELRITHRKVRKGDLFKRPTGEIVKVDKVRKIGFYYSDIGKDGVGGWCSFEDGKYLQPIIK
jgi:hypothetical protein